MKLLLFLTAGLAIASAQLNAEESKKEVSKADVGKEDKADEKPDDVNVEDVFEMNPFGDIALSDEELLKDDAEKPKDETEKKEDAEEGKVAADTGIVKAAGKNKKANDDGGYYSSSHSSKSSDEYYSSSHDSSDSSASYSKEFYRQGPNYCRRRNCQRDGAGIVHCDRVCDGGVKLKCKRKCKGSRRDRKCKESCRNHGKRWYVHKFKRDGRKIRHLTKYYNLGGDEFECQARCRLRGYLVFCRKRCYRNDKLLSDKLVQYDVHLSGIYQTNTADAGYYGGGLAEPSSGYGSAFVPSNPSGKFIPSNPSGKFIPSNPIPKTLPAFNPSPKSGGFPAFNPKPVRVLNPPRPSY